VTGPIEAEALDLRASVLSRWPVCVAAVLATVAVVAGWRGTDLTTQVHGADLFRAQGFVLWDNYWFGGYPTLDYSVVTPLLGALFNPLVVAAVASVVSAFIADRLLRARYGRAAVIGSLSFAISTATNLAVGRVPFALGIAFALAAALALQRNHRWLAVPLAAVSSLASPVAGVLLMICVIGWASCSRARWATAAVVTVAAVAPIAAIALVFPSAGVFPFEGWLLAVTLIACAAVYAAVSREDQTIRRICIVYAVVCLATFAVPNALGGNVARLALYGAGPLLASAQWTRHRVWIAVTALPLMVWQWYPAVDGMMLAGRDPSTHASFYAPLVHAIDAQTPSIARLEIPMTQHRWEAVYVAASIPLARGQERQIDMTRNHIFYDNNLDPASYHQWLSDTGVTYVALPDVPLDDSAHAEAQLLRTKLPYLDPVWSNSDWTLWKVKGATDLTSGPATLTHLGTQDFTLRVTSPGDVTVRVRASSHWEVPDPGCATSDLDGWTVLRNLPQGVVTVSQALAGTPC
jgi:hypothetical protein